MSGNGEKVRIIIKKKKGHGHGHHGGAWKVAYADFVTAMMALFIVLWLLTQADLQTRQAIAQYFRNPGIMATGSGVTSKQDSNSIITSVTPELSSEARASEQRLLEKEAEEVKDMLAKIREDSSDLEKLAGQIDIRITDDGLVIDLVDSAGELLFEQSSSSLKPTVVRLLEKLGPILARVPNTVEVSGHTDSTPFAGTARKTNWDLSYERANAAREVLTRSGLRPGQLTRVQAHADSEPLIREDPRDPRNRRLSVLVVRRGPPPRPDELRPDQPAGVNDGVDPSDPEYRLDGPSPSSSPPPPQSDPAQGR